MSISKEIIGEDVYDHIEKEAEKEVALAMQFKLIDQYKQERYYRWRPLLTILVNEFRIFQEKGFRFTPIDIFQISFESKLQHTCQNEKEYFQRRGGGNFMEEPPFVFRWEEHNSKIDDIVLAHLDQLEQMIFERTLASEITNFSTDRNMGSANDFLVQLFNKLSLPFGVLIDESLPDLNSDGSVRHKIGRVTYTTVGSYSYVYHYASAQLRTFLNALRIAGFLYRGQIDFGMWKIIMMAPGTPWFTNTNEIGGVYSWEEDKKKPWEKIPDGCLFLSFGYRGITTLYLDNRTFGGIEKFFLDNIVIFKKMKNPWTSKSINDIAISLDILSSATQISDLGAKILQIYCCLEHLFVPKDVKKDNIKYIIGAVNVLNPQLLPWFTKLYELRCNYAHKGYVLRDDQTLSLVFESVANTVSLLTMKLKQS